MNNFALSGCDIGQDSHKLATGKVAYLAAPQGLHSLHAKVFKEELVISIGQVVRKLKEPVTALIDHALMQARDGRFGLAPIRRKLDFAGQLALGGLQFSHSLTIVQRTINLFTVRRSEESFQTKVESCAVTRQDAVGLVDLFLNDEVQKKIAKTITLNGDSLNVRWNIAAFAEFIDLTLNADLVVLKQLPTGLFEGETAVLLDLLKTWGRRSHFALEIAKEQLIGFVNALDNILDRLATNHVPMAVFGQAFQFGDVFHQGIRVQALAEQAIVPAMQGNTVVINQATDIDLPVQVLILFRPIELELVRLHWLFCSSI